MTIAHDAIAAKAPRTVPDGQTPLDDKLNHRLLDVIREGGAARDAGTGSPYHGHSLEHCLHATGWVSRDLRLALNESHARAEKAEAERDAAIATARIAYDALWEINPDNYDHNDVCKVNDGSVEAILTLAPLMGETHGKTAEWWVERAKAAEAERDRVAAEWAETSQRNYQRAKAAEARVAKLVEAYDATNPLRTADMHHADCKCLRCEVDDARAALKGDDND